MQLILEDKETEKIEKYYTIHNQNLRVSGENNPDNVYVIANEKEDRSLTLKE